MSKDKQNSSVGAPTYRQALAKAMKNFLMAPFFPRQGDVVNGGRYRQRSFKPF